MDNVKFTYKLEFNTDISVALIVPQLREQLLNIAKSRQNVGSDYLSQIFNASDVTKALRGDHDILGFDLLAHLGMNDTNGNRLADQMLDLIKKINIMPLARSQNVIFKVQATEANWVKYTELPLGDYVSIGKKTAIIIPVLGWMLLNPNIDIGQAAYEIKFNLNTKEISISRSGRALMQKLTDQGTPYVFPHEIFRGSQNFIEYTIGQPGVAVELVRKLLNL